MEIVKVDQLSFAARAGALDGSLAYASVYQQHRDIVAATAVAGLRSLEQILSETGAYGQAMRTLKEASDKIYTANEMAAKDPFQAASSQLHNQHNNATIDAFKWHFSHHDGRASQAQSDTWNARNGTVANNPERAIAERAVAAANLYREGTQALVNNVDIAGGRAKINQAIQDAVRARDDAALLRDSLLNKNPVDWTRYNQIHAIVTAADSVRSKGGETINYLNDAPIAHLRNYSPTTHDLGNGYSLATWGNSGYWTLTDSAGKGVIVHPNGTVDSLYEGPGWKFDTTSTFVLPGDTKITVNPGSPANLLVSRGVHAFTIDGMKANSWPSVSSYTDLNGRLADRGSNDGHIVELNGNAGAWRNGSNPLGDGGSREVIGSTGLSNELRRDPTDVEISQEMRDFLTANGIPLASLDYDSDGKLNNEELSLVANYATSAVKSIQETYDQALARLAQANSALDELNQMIEALRRDADRREEDRVLQNADGKGALQAIERRLLAALQELQGTQPVGVPATDVEGSAAKVLNQLDGLTQSSSFSSSTSNFSSATSPGTATPPPTNGASAQTGVAVPAVDSGQPANANGSVGGSSTSQSTTAQPDPIGDGLRRAGRLLSGILGGGNLNILEVPTLPDPSSKVSVPTSLPGTVPPESETVNSQTGAATVTSPPTGAAVVETDASTQTGNTKQTEVSPLANLLNQLQAATAAELGAELESLNPANVSLGLDALLTTLEELGLFQSSPDQVGLLTAAFQQLIGLLGDPASNTNLVTSEQDSATPLPPKDAGSSSPDLTLVSQSEPKTKDVVNEGPAESSAPPESPSLVSQPEPKTKDVVNEGLAESSAPPESPSLSKASESQSRSLVPELSEVLQALLQSIDLLGAEIAALSVEENPNVAGNSSEVQSGKSSSTAVSKRPASLQQLFEQATGRAGSSIPQLNVLGRVLAEILAGQGSASSNVSVGAQSLPLGGTSPASAASLPGLALSSQQVLAILSGKAELGSAGASQSSASTDFESGGLAKLSRAAEQLFLVLQGLAALGSAGGSQSSSVQSNQSPTVGDLSRGLQSLFLALSGAGQTQTSSSGQGLPFRTFADESSSGSAVQSKTTTITGNFQTDPELLKIIRENLNKAIQTEQRQLSQASTLFTQSQQIVQKFVSLIKEDDLVREVVKSDSLSDEQQALFDDRMQELRKDWGVEWGSDDSRTPAGQSQLVTKVMQSGMMV